MARGARGRVRHPVQRHHTVDAVTGLADREWAMRALGRALATSAKTNEPVSVLSIRLENLEEVGRRYGEEVHLRLLGDIGAILRDQLRSADTACGLDAEEFVLVLSGADRDAATRIARRLERQVQRLMTSNLIDLPVLLCAGSASAPEDATKADALLLAAAEMMDYARRLGGGTFAYSLDYGTGSPVHVDGDDAVASSAAEVTVRALRGALMAHDAGIAKHSERVAGYAAAIAQRAGFPLEDMPLLRAAALLHDVGMLETDASVLRKPGKLTAEEYLQVRRHPVVGYEILRSTPWLQPVATYVRYHHERFDGHGYPEGLQGLEIPLASRILAVAEAYDAMRTTWPYRKRLTEAETKDRLVAGSGSLYDPDIVGALLAVVEPERKSNRNRRHAGGEALILAPGIPRRASTG